MFNGEKASLLKKIYYLVRTDLVYRLSFKKKFSSIGSQPMVWGIWNVVVYGPNISIGKNVLFAAADNYTTTLTTVRHAGGEGSIYIGDGALVMNGVRISSASSIHIGRGCMLANFCYIMDADWHDIHDRTQSPGKTRPVVLKDGAWIGDSAIICKGVTVGTNSIVGAGSVVRRDVPDNTIVAGNPAVLIGTVDPSAVRTMADYYTDQRNTEALS